MRLDDQSDYHSFAPFGAWLFPNTSEVPDRVAQQKPPAALPHHVLGGCW